MTAIAYRDGIMAADGLDTSGGLVESLEATKIVKRHDGALCGCAGELTTCARLTAAFLANKLHEDYDFASKGSYAALIVEADGSVHRATKRGLARMSPAPFYAEGCAYQLLTGAMAAGATAEEAVEIACRWDTRCGGTVHVETLGQG